MTFPLFTAIQTGLNGVAGALAALNDIKLSLDGITALQGPAGPAGADGADGAGVYSAWANLATGGGNWVSSLQYRTTSDALWVWGSITITAMVTPSTNDIMIYSFPVGSETADITFAVSVLNNGIYNTKTVRVTNSLGRLTYLGDGTLTNPIFYFNHIIPY